ncbi:hypothetical protein ATANTOWER_027117 [Ataeniobius toweri]|uniref:Uncharacterized protein n=1 Tax=Ataeniobius toweri TaxID=208326 RepID=A0ABU7AR74_9TELE|nr:hypothetical protein [Ataeniobius toweri]
MTSVAAGTVNKACLIESPRKYGSTFQNAMQIMLVAIIVTRSTRPAAGMHLVKHQIFVKAEECAIFISLRSTATTPAFGTVRMPASVSDSSSAARNMREEMFEATEALQYKQLDVVLIYLLKFRY